VFLVLGLGVAVGLAVLVGRWRWRAETRTLRERLETARQRAPAARVTHAELRGLPPPVARYLQRVLPADAPMIASVRLRHVGSFNTDALGERWRPFTSDQFVITRRPGFDWNGKIRMAPGMAVRVHDAYVAGEGVLHASLLGVITLARPPATADLAEGELMRFLAEAVWYPTVLLPGQGVTWEACGADAATATLTDGPHRVALTFCFGADGLVDRVRSEARGRMVGDAVLPTPWEGRFREYAGRGAMCVPLEGEVAWLLKDGPHPYWRGRIVEVAHEFQRGGSEGVSLRDVVLEGSL
jgi:hypothetical protein